MSFGKPLTGVRATHSMFCLRGAVTLALLSVLVSACGKAETRVAASQEAPASVDSARSLSAPSREATGDRIAAATFRPGSPFGVALGHDSVWMDSTLLVDAARTIGVPKLAAFEDDTTMSIACGYTKGPNTIYVVMYANRGDRARVHEIDLSHEAPRAAPVLASCVALALTEGDVSTTIAGLQLGTTRAELEHWTGPPVKTPNHNVARYILGDSLGSKRDENGRDPRVVLIIEYRDGAVVDLDIYRNDRFLDGPCC